MSSFEKLIREFGEVEHQGCRLALAQQAECSNGPDRDNMTYEARAIDADGNEYRVSWDCLEGWFEMEDESDRCDWSKYEVREI